MMAAAHVADRDLDGLPVRVHYPAGATNLLPVIVFSHGVGGSRLGYGYLGRFWASHGYVSIHPSHREQFQAQVYEVENPSPALRLAMNAAIADAANWEARPRDIARAIDGLGALEASIPALQGRLDPARIGVAGHSYGAYTTLLCAGARVQAGLEERDFTEPRASAFAALSPPGNGARGLSERSWRSLHRPLLCVSGTRDSGVQGEPPDWREDAHRGMPEGNKTLIVLDGAAHSTFAGGQPRNPAPAPLLQDIEVATLWFWNRHLKGIDAPFPVLHCARVEQK
jgi:predicted dienelactone hydrolase